MHRASRVARGALPSRPMQEEPSSPRRVSPRARALSLQLAAEARAEWGFATEIVARAFREDRQLSSGDRRQVAETVYGLVRWERRLEAILDEVLARSRGRRDALSAVGRQELKLIIYELRSGIPEAAVKADVRRLAGRDLDLSDVASDDAGLGDRQGLDREALRVSYPTWLFERLAAAHGENQAMALASAMNARAPMCVRTNTVKVSREELVARLAEEGVVATPTRLPNAARTRRSTSACETFWWMVLFAKRVR